MKEIEPRKRSEGKAAHEQDPMGTLLANIRESEERYRLLVEKSPDVLYSVKPDGIITYVSPQMTQYGYTSEEVISRSFLEFVVPEHHQEVLQKFDEGNRNGTSFATEFQWQGKGGSRHWVEAVGEIICDNSGQPISQIGTLRDISDRKKAEEALLDVRNQYQRFIEDLGDAFMVYSHRLDGTLTYVGPGIKSIFGIHREEAIGNDWSRIIKWDSEDLDLAGENIGNIVSGLEYKRMEMSFRHPDGKQCTVFISPHPTKNSEGSVVSIEGIVEDISERRQTEETLRQSMAIIQDLYDNAPDMFVSVDAKTGKILDCNQTLANALGYTREEIIGRPIFDMYTPDSAEHAKTNVFPAFVKTGTIKGEELQLQRKDGSKIDVSLNVSAVRDEQGGILYSRSVWRDITKRKEVEEALKEAQADLEKKVSERTAQLSETVDKLRDAELRYRTVADFTYDWEYWRNLDGTLQYISPSCERISGYTPQQFIDNPSLFREIIIPEDQDLWDKHYHNSLKEQKQREIQFRIRRSDGSIRWIEHACQPVTSDQGEFSGFRVSNRNITKRKEGEIKLQNSYSEMAEMKAQIEADRIYLGEEIKLEHDHENIVGNSDVLKYVLFRAEQVAVTETSVLILGETGTGKGLIARAIHNASLRKERPLIKVDCASLPANLIESELFGHEKGAFTGAVETRVGRFELANGATLFLDEIGELPLDLQSKFLRVLQDGEFERLGSSETLRTDVRVISATNRNLEEDIRKKHFRMDLWYRLNVFTISIPPLRERSEDIDLLVKYMIKNLERKFGKRIRSIPTNVLAKLQKFSWPGNVRELENVIERAVINTQGDVLQLEDPLNPHRSEVAESPDLPIKSLEEMEREHILLVLRKTNWRIHGKDGAAALLNINPSTLRGRMRKQGIHRPPYKI